MCYVGYQKVGAQLFKHEVKTTEIAMISPSAAEVQVTATGYVIPQRTSKVGAKLPGRIAKVFVKEGDFVEAGQTLVARVRSTTSYARGTNVAWSLAVRDAAGRQLSHQSLDLEKGFLP